MTSHEPIPAGTKSGRFPVRIAVVQGSEPDDWRGIYNRLDNAAHGATGILLKCVASSATFLGTVTVSGAFALALVRVFPDIYAFYLLMAVLLPGLLAGAAIGQASGKLFLRLRYRLDDATRRGFATRLSLARAPAEWPTAVKRWLFTGDWMGSPAYDLRLPYVRIFIPGEAPATCGEEDALWREIHGQISGDSLWEAGANIREISYPSELPAWAKEVACGDGYSDLAQRIGQNEAEAWVMHLWRRACRQWPALGANDYPEKARRECFEMHSLTISDGRTALIVVLRPATFVMELEQEERQEKRAA